MKKTIYFNQAETVTVKGETLSAIAFQFVTSDDADLVADVANLKNISLDVAVHRNGAKSPVYICQTYLDKLLVAYKDSSTSLNDFLTAVGLKRIFVLPLGGSLALGPNDSLEVRLDAKSSAFTDLDVTKSAIFMETVPSVGSSPFLKQLTVHNIGNNEDLVDMDLKGGVVKIVHYNNEVLTASGDDYVDITKAKIVDLDLTASGFRKNVSENVLFAENIEYNSQFGVAASKIKNLILYNSSFNLNGVKLKAKLDKPADTLAAMLVQRTVRV